MITLDEYVREVVAAAPPLTSAQSDKIRALLSGDTHPTGPRTPTAYELEQQRLENERAAALAEAKSLAAAMMDCDVCSKPPEAHYGLTHHKWVPGRANKILSQYR